jgi:hypothetical protein
MAKRKPNKLPPLGFCMNPKTGRIDKVLNITESTLDGIQDKLNEMNSIIRACEKWEHSKALDRRITKFLGSER